MHLQVPTLAATDVAKHATTQVFDILNKDFTGNFTVRFWDGTMWEPTSGLSEFTFVLNHPGAARAMFLNVRTPAVGFCEAYIFDDFDIEGDIFGFTRWLRHLTSHDETRTLFEKLRIGRWLIKLPKTAKRRDLSVAGKATRGDHRIVRDREAIAYTYDVPGEFYELFLDKALQYTCGYFSHPDESLDDAQVRKMDHVCRKLRLQPGERFVDFGCGLGGLVIHAAQKYGVEAVGFTLSRVQAECAARDIAAAGLTGRARVEFCDYREFTPNEKFDKAASVGMGEHVGHKNLPVFFAKVHECLRPGGLYLHHTINLAPGQKPPAWTAFAHKYVFPNGEMQSPLFVLQTGAEQGFEIRDVENLREHYVLTLEHWVRRLDSNRERAIALVGEVRYRIFRLYMAGATMGFKYGRYYLTHSLFAKLEDGFADVPMTRADLYA